MAKSMLELLSNDSFLKTAEEKVKGGKADGHSLDEYPKDQIEKGKKVEMEHTGDPEVAEEISMDHLEEEKEMDPSKKKEDLEYYDELGDMEDGLKKKANGDMLAHYQEVRKKSPAFRKGFEKAAACNHDRRFSGRRPRKPSLNKPDVSEEGASPIRGGRGPGQGPSVKKAFYQPALMGAGVGAGVGALLGGEKNPETGKTEGRGISALRGGAAGAGATAGLFGSLSAAARYYTPSAKRVGDNAAVRARLFSTDREFRPDITGNRRLRAAERYGKLALKKRSGRLMKTLGLVGTLTTAGGYLGHKAMKKWGPKHKSEMPKEESAGAQTKSAFVSGFEKDALMDKRWKE